MTEIEGNEVIPLVGFSKRGTVRLARRILAFQSWCCTVECVSDIWGMNGIWKDGERKKMSDQDKYERRVGSSSHLKKDNPI